jgi:hypothetical protein
MADRLITQGWLEDRESPNPSAFTLIEARD